MKKWFKSYLCSKKNTSFFWRAWKIRLNLLNFSSFEFDAKVWSARAQQPTATTKVLEKKGSWDSTSCPHVIGWKNSKLGALRKIHGQLRVNMEVKKQIQEIQILTRTSNLNLYFPVRQSPHRATPRLASLFFREEQGSHITGKTWNTPFFSWFLCAFSFL